MTAAASSSASLAAVRSGLLRRDRTPRKLSSFSSNVDRPENWAISRLYRPGQLATLHSVVFILAIRSSCLCGYRSWAETYGFVVRIALLRPSRQGRIDEIP